MTEIDRGRPEPVRAVEPRVKPPVHIPPTPPIEERPPKKPSRAKKVIAGGVTAAVLGTGGFVGYRALEKAFNIENPIPTITTPNPPQPEPTKTPKPEQSPETIETPHAPRGDLWWEHKRAPLGILLKEQVLQPDGITQSLISGIVTDVYQKQMKITGQQESVWMISVYLGQHPKGQEINANFVLGPDHEIIARSDLLTGSLPADRNAPPGTGEHAYIVEAVDLAKFLESHLDRQFAFYLITKDSINNLNQNISPSDCDKNPHCVFYKSILPDFVPYNQKLYQILSGSNQKLNSSFGYVSEIYVGSQVRNST